MKRTPNPFGGLGIFLPLFLTVICCCVAGDSAPTQLPPDLPMNRNAGRGANLTVPLQLESGETVQFLLDTGSYHSLIDKSLEPKLGKRLGTTKVSMFGKNERNSGIYATPKIYAGTIPLMLGSNIATYDFNLLGMDCLRHYCIQLDFQSRKVRFLDPNHLKIEELGKAYPIRLSRWGRPFIYHNSLIGEVRTNTPVTTRELPPEWALLDTGYFADGRVDTGTNGPGWLHLPDCGWDNQSYTSLTVGQGENANLLGLRFLARHLVTLDFPNRRLYLKRTSVGPLVAENRQGGRWLSAELETAATFLFHLHQEDCLPGASKDEHGSLRADPNPPAGYKAMAYPLSWTFHGVVNGKSFTNHYTVLRPATNDAWQIQRAWRTDSQGRTVEEWPVKMATPPPNESPAPNPAKAPQVHAGPQSLGGR